MTKVPNSFDMWSQYSNGHKGFLIEPKKDFNTYPCMLPINNKPYDVSKVEYVNEHIINLDDMVIEEGRLQEELFNKQMFFKKLSRWQSEHEYRLVRPLSDLPDYTPLMNKPHRDERIHLFEFSLECIESIIFGACMSYENIDLIIRACKDSKVNLLQAIIIRDEKDISGKIGKVTFVSKDMFPHLDTILPFNFIADSRYLDYRRNPITVSSLSELPYWENSREWVQLYYKRRKSRRTKKE